jgi:glycerate 2-kinase
VLAEIQVFLLFIFTPVLSQQLLNILAAQVMLSESREPAKARVHQCFQFREQRLLRLFESLARHKIIMRAEMPDLLPQREQQFGRMRDVAREIFTSALSNASIENAFARNVNCERRVLRIGEDLHDLDAYSRVFVVSMGKAAHTMAAALEAQVGSSLEGIVASVEPASQLHTSQIRGFRYFHGGHPTPTAESIEAATAILKSLDALDSASLAIFMISGGGSSIVEKPIDSEISLTDLATTYQTLVHSGAPIAEINAIRKHLSAVKGGRLALAAYPAQQVSILVSDVPDATPDALASGPTMPDSTSIYDCEQIAAKYNLLGQFPKSVANLFRQHALDETPKSDDHAFIRARWWTVLSNQVAIDQAAVSATRAGFAVEIDNSCDDWPYDKAADYLLNRLRELRSKVSRVCLISGGEVIVAVRNGGMGGRNQQFALACAEQISGHDITVLSAGTDGIDGNSPAAGAIVDGSTVNRAGGTETLRRALSSFDAYPLLDAIGDAIVTGPTGNNLRDLRILLAY